MAEKRERRWKNRSLIFLLLSSLSAVTSGVLDIPVKHPDSMAARSAKQSRKKEPLFFCGFLRFFVANSSGVLRILGAACGSFQKVGRGAARPDPPHVFASGCVS
jgi:hypothetical protein